MIFKMMESLLVVSGFVNKTYVTRGENIVDNGIIVFIIFCN